MRIHKSKIGTKQLNIKNNIKFTLICTIFLMLNIGILYSIQQLKEYSERLEIVLHEPLSEKEAFLMQKESRQMEKSYEFILWNQKMKQIISAPSLSNKSLEVTVLALCGKSNLLLENVLEFDYQERNICLVDKKTAYEMYGTTEVKGLILSYMGMQYEIAGVINMEEGIFMYQISGEGEAYLNRISVTNYGQKSLAYLKEVFDTQWVTGYRIDYELINFLLMLVISVVSLVNMFMIGWQLINEIFTYKNICYIICDTAVGVLNFIILEKSIFIPEDYLSDLANKQFWVELIQEKKESCRLFLMVEKSIFDMGFIVQTIWSMLGLIGVMVIMNVLWVKYVNSAS